MTRRPYLDETGKRYGRFLVLEWLGNSKWLCRCDCGNERQVLGTTLRAGRSQSCGCFKTEKSRLPRIVLEEAGKRYGKLTVIEREGATKSKETTWLCLCDCGNKTVVRGSRLRNGKVQNCGCWAPPREYKPREGTKHHNWKGEQVGYHALHIWLKNHKTKTGVCSICQATRYTEWGNIAEGKRRSRNLDDYIEVCKPCHMKMDGHPWVTE